MSKIITDSEIVRIIQETVEGANGNLEDAVAYERFLADLGKLVANHFGAELTHVSSPMSNLDYDRSEARWCLHFSATESTPDDGGVFSRFDKDVSVDIWFAESPQRSQMNLLTG